MKVYAVLDNQVFEFENSKIIPIRYEDRFDIMKWRNEQIYHLRQNKPLTLEDQEDYFNNVVSKLFDKEQPGQILFSYLEDGICIGYGGLVHINWIDKNAEISFIMDSDLEKDYFQKHWGIFLPALAGMRPRSLDHRSCSPIRKTAGHFLILQVEKQPDRDSKPVY